VRGAAAPRFVAGFVAGFVAAGFVAAGFVAAGFVAPAAPVDRVGWANAAGTAPSATRPTRTVAERRVNAAVVMVALSSSMVGEGTC
jgi:hypothetical protein